MADHGETIRALGHAIRDNGDVRGHTETSGRADLTLPTLQDVERRHIERVLAATSGCKRRAAAILGISRWALARRLRKLGLDPTERIASS